MELNMRPHLNGDTRETLAAQVIKLNEALTRAQIALREAAPHSRNYQHLDDRWEAYEADRKKWEQGRRAMADLIDFANAMAEAVA